MLEYYSKTESGFFCILLIAFLYIFQIKTSQNGKNKLLYLFLIIEVIFSVLGNIIQRVTIQNICFVASGISCFFAVWFLCRTLKIKNILSILSGVVFGIVSVCSLRCGINATSYLLTLAVVLLFIIEQQNIITVDNLTKLYNRYGMDAELKEQLREYEREHSDSFYLIVCDLDNFKYINDTWGHSEGDRALVLVADALAKTGKKFSAEVFRIGGDEFVVIVDTSQESVAVEVINAMENELDNIDFRDDYDIKISMGYALYDGVAAIDELLSNADKKMYEAKKSRK